MESIGINLDSLSGFVPKDSLSSRYKDANLANVALHKKTGKGNDFLGWVDLPSSLTDNVLQEIEDAAKVIKNKAEILVVIGIGGSYLGAKAALEALSHSFTCLQNKRKHPLVLFAGHNISEDYLTELREILADKSFALCVISKSGTTTEPAIAFRILKQDIEDKYGREEAATRIIAVTDASKGALRQLADKERYKTFVISDDIGGRYSVLTPVGLLPLAIAGIDIRKFIAGAREMETQTASNVPIENNTAAKYAIIRNLLYEQGKKIEILVNYNPKLQYLAEWWKQLYGESEGKEHKGIFPASVNFTTDLHSMGQYIQDGQRNLFETVITVNEANSKLYIPEDASNLDKLNYIAGKRIDEVNKKAELGTMLAHLDGGVPNLKITIPKLDEYYIGQLFYFFEKACGISGYILDVNPFDQPGVEDYKVNMFALLGKPGFEKQTAAIRERTANGK